MPLAAEKEYQHIGETEGCADHDHDLVHELSKKLDALWRYDQYIANADGRPNVQSVWREFKKQCLEDVKRLKQLIADEIKKGCF
jgi:protoheme ferro-lyase